MRRGSRAGCSSARSSRSSPGCSCGSCTTPPVYADRFDTALFVIGTLVVSCVLLVAAAASTWSAVGGALISTGSVVASALGVRLLDGPASSGGLARLVDELRATLSDGYLDPGAVVLSGALLAIVIIRVRRSGSVG